MGQGSRGSARSLESLDPRLRGNDDQEARAPAFAPAPKLGAVRAEGAKGRGWRHALGPWFAQQIMGARRTLVRLVDRPLVHRHRRVVDRLGQRRVGVRSEEHTSELQSLMRISYAVFCLKKKNNNHYT